MVTAAAPTTANTASSAAGSSIAQTGTTTVTGLTNNFNDFLKMLMTQLQHQDPTQPMDATQFTTQLVQFSSVEQQLATNTNLAKLIALTQASQIEQSSAMLGKPATVTSDSLTLQNGASQLNFTTAQAQPLAITVYNAAGVPVQSSTLTSATGANTWTWNGKAANGVTLPDGAYKVSVNAIGADGATSAVPFAVTGTVTSVQNQNGTVVLTMGGLSVPFSAVQSVGG